MRSIIYFRKALGVLFYDLRRGSSWAPFYMLLCRSPHSLCYACMGLLFALPLQAQLGSEKGRPQPGIRYFHSDHIGSSTLTTDENGQVVSRITYLPYGEVWDTYSNGPNDFRPKFTGEELDDETQLYDYGARYYDPVTGRFTSADPGMGAGIEHPAAFNRYTYAGGNPITVTDPTGRTISEGLKLSHLPPSDLPPPPPSPPTVGLPSFTPLEICELTDPPGTMEQQSTMEVPAGEDEDGVVAPQSYTVYLPVVSSTPYTLSEPSAAAPVYGPVEAPVQDPTFGPVLTEILSPLELQIESPSAGGVAGTITLGVDENGELKLDAGLVPSFGGEASYYNGIGGGGGVTFKVDKDGNLWSEYSGEVGLGYGTKVRGHGFQICAVCFEVKYVSGPDGRSTIELEAKSSVTLGPVTLKAGQKVTFDVTQAPPMGSPEHMEFREHVLPFFHQADCAPDFRVEGEIYRAFERQWEPGERDPHEGLNLMPDVIPLAPSSIVPSITIPLDPNY